MNDALSSAPVSRDELFSPLLPRVGSPPVCWRISREPVAYPDALAEMDALAEAIAAGRQDETVWLLEHPALYTAGTSANASDLVQPERFPIFQTGRGGQFTYHGPGQRVAYVMLDLRRRTQDVRLYVASLEEWLIRVLASFNVRGERREDRVGVWVRQPASIGDGEDKIAALGIRVRRWVTMHGISLNVEPDLSHFDGIVPCGVRDHGVTSLVRLGLPLTMDDVDLALRREFEGIFGPTRLEEREG